MSTQRTKLQLSTQRPLSKPIDAPRDARRFPKGKEILVIPSRGAQENSTLRSSGKSLPEKYPSSVKRMASTCFWIFSGLEEFIEESARPSSKLCLISTPFKFILFKNSQ